MVKFLNVFEDTPVYDILILMWKNLAAFIHYLCSGVASEIHEVCKTRYHYEFKFLHEFFNNCMTFGAVVL